MLERHSWRAKEVRKAGHFMKEILKKKYPHVLKDEPAGKTSLAEHRALAGIQGGEKKRVYLSGKKGPANQEY